MSHHDVDEFDGWEIYPQNLHLSSLDVDDARIAGRISWLAKELFVDKSASKFSFLDQSYTWSRLEICEEHFRKLFTRLRVDPSFLDIVHVFCEKVRPVEEGFNGFFFNHSDQAIWGSLTVNNKDSSYSIGYNVKYVARHGRTTPKDPFSIREVGVYQHYSSLTQKCSWVFLQASEQLQDRLRRTFQHCDDTAPSNQFLLHSMILLSLSEDWRDYLVYLEEEFSMLVDRGFYANIMGPQFEGDVEANYSDIRKLQILTDKLQRLRQILGLNLRLCQRMKDSMEIIQRDPSIAIPGGINSVQTKLNKFLYDQQTSLDRIQTLISRSTGISQLVLNILEIRATEASKQMNVEMQKLTEQGVNENKLMKKLTEQTTQDTKSMMIISLISAIFLPATFLASLFGSNFFVYSQDGNMLTVASNFWIYIVFTTIFSGAAIAFWFLWKQRRVRLPEADDLEMQGRE
ncbi:uncharacterized protein PAC_02409 [Phialocephala subalpina]|uniref:CorA-like transporter domain-containing protein n=1 Tax=Phialocephala subalpina TaxID=576137 RepID=A0A1L7WID6_9HELO|nr:uncharacterized protein PAC_02409 [Phialocephala subalpina]